jgi:hypothetical protein
VGFWENMNDELKNAVEEGWSAVKESARIGKLRYRKHTLHKQAEKAFAEIGGIVYEKTKVRAQDDILSGEVLRLVDKIKAIEEETEAIEKEIAAVKKKESSL